MNDEIKKVETVLLDAAHFAMLQELMLENMLCNEEEELAWLIEKEWAQRAQYTRRRRIMAALDGEEDQ